MPFVWELIAAPIALAAAAFAFLADLEGVGLTFLVASGCLLAEGVARRRRLRTIQQKRSVLETNQADLIQRMDRGESLEQIAMDYERLHQIPLTQTLLCLGDWLLGILATQENTNERQELCHFLISRQSLQPLPPPEEMIGHFNFDESVYMVQENVDAIQEDGPGKKFSGMLIIARVYIYFIKAPSVGEEFAGSYATEHLVHLVPYLSVAHAGFELVHGMHQELAEYFSHSMIKRLKHHFSSAPSFAIPLRAITRIGMVPARPLEPVRLEIQSTDQSGMVRHWQFATQVSRSDASVHRWIDVIRAACVSQGVLIAR